MPAHFPEPVFRAARRAGFIPILPWSTVNTGKELNKGHFIKPRLQNLGELDTFQQVLEQGAVL